MGAGSGEMTSHISQSVAQAAGPCRGQGSCQPFPESSSRSSGQLAWMTSQQICIKHPPCARHGAGPRGRGREQDRLVPAVAELMFW